MSGLRSRLSHFVLSASVMAVACAGLDVPASQARDGRSRTSAEPIAEMPGPNDHDGDHLILEMPPMHPVRSARLPGAQAPKQAESLTAPQKSARAGGKSGKATAKADRPSQPVATVPAATFPAAAAPAAQNDAAPSIAAAPNAQASQEQPRSGFDFDAASRLTPQTLGSVAATPAANESAPTPAAPQEDVALDGGGVSVVASLKPAAEQPSPFALVETPEDASTISLDTKANFAVTQQMALGEDTVAPSTPNELADTIVLKAPLETQETEKSTSVVDVAASLAAAPNAQTSGPAKVPGAETVAASSAPSTFFYPRVQRVVSPRQQSGSALSREIEQVANSVPPMQFELPRGKDEPASVGAPAAMRPTQISGGFQWHMPSLEVKPREESKEPQVAEASKPDSEESAAARKAEQEHKDAIWAKIAKAQADSKARAAAEAAKNPDAENQLPVFRVIKKLMHPEARNEEERAYAAMLKEGVKGPIRVRIGDRATLWLPSGYVYIDAERAREVMDGEAGLADPSSQGVILPETRTPTWMAYVDLLDEGYVADENAKAMDAASLLAGMKTSVNGQNAERARYGVAPLTVDRWIRAPQYAAAKHGLNACMAAVDASAADPNERLVNCFSYTLGRRGALKILVTGEESNLAAFEHEAVGLADHITYDQGAGYKDYVAGQDGVAEYGAAELLGGAVGLKSIAGIAAAAGAGKNQELFLTHVMSYWEEIVTAVIVLVLAFRWMQANRAEEREEEEDLRATPRVSFFRLASSRLGAMIRGLFETEEIVEPGAPKKVATAAETTGSKAETKSVAAEKKSLLAGLRAKVSNLPLPVLRKAAKDATPLAAGTSAAEKPATTPDVAAKTHAATGKITALREKLAALPIFARFKKTTASATPAAATTNAGATRDRVGAKVETLAAAPAAETASASASKLSKLASVMRKKVEEPTSAAPVALGRIAPKREAAERQAAAPAPLEVADTSEIPAPVAAAAESAKPPRPEPVLSTSVADILDLVEPGDTQATTIAREALQQAHG